ncbi:putative ras guanyl-nucleotide exchange factor RasGEF [Bombardia bombarda]|uniref:Ras guanyl-nucleotide exchange factor RasGEF n=1 Tax=Bombardia bombarda TaxID=252184 RepID=A0AA40C8T6_9PEZI|nr:putative ras guanyl-nucleotide exchange factor RasGEF [Bombardia bombarda]
MASTQPAKLRALYRSLLRELPPRPILTTPRAQLHQRLRDNFTPSAPSPTNPDLAVAQAEQFVTYFKAQRVYVNLLERYNPGMGMDEEERVRLSARRVGMDLPAEYGAGKKQKK